MRKFTLVLAVVFTTLFAQAADTLRLSSPDKQIRVHTWYDNGLYYQVFYNNDCIVMPSFIDMQLNDGKALSLNNAVASSKIQSVNSQIISPVPEKRKVIPDVYNELRITLKQPFAVVFRAYDDGVAYRIQTRLKDSITVKNETAIFNFPKNHPVYFPQISKREDADSFHTSFEELYPLKPLNSISNGNMAYTPVLIAPETAPKIAVTESDLLDYPGMFLSGNNNSSLHGVFAPYPLEETIVGGEFKQRAVTKRAGFIAKTNGTRSFPWRVLMIAEEDKELPSNDLVYRLASPSKVEDVSWINPGKGTDEWTIGINLFNVPFKSGINTATYKYYIDFVKRFGFDRIMMDAGWSDNTDLFKINPDINMDTLVAYAKEKGIKISMWTLSMTLDRQLTVRWTRFNKWGVDFIMTDFIDRDDQPVVNLV
jgi:alpha-glucosidase